MWRSYLRYAKFFVCAVGGRIDCGSYRENGVREVRVLASVVKILHFLKLHAPLGGTL